MAIGRLLLPYNGVCGRKLTMIRLLFTFKQPVRVSGVTYKRPNASWTANHYQECSDLTWSNVERIKGVGKR